MVTTKQKSITDTKRKERHYIMIKGSIQEDITITNIYLPNIGAPQYIRQMLTAIKEEIDSNTVIVGDFNTSLTPMHRSSRQKINKETQAFFFFLNFGFIYLFIYGCVGSSFLCEGFL